MKEGWHILVGLLVATFSFSQTISGLEFPITELESTQPPVIQDGPVNQVVVNGNTVVMKCRVASSVPIPKISWMFKNREVSGERFELLSSGDLKIERVDFRDEGTYTCKAENKFGSKMINADLKVKQRTRITEKPEDQVVGVGHNVRFYCKISRDDTLMAKIDWLKDGSPIDYKNEPRFKSRWGMDLAISGVTELDSGEYTCVVRTRYDEVRASGTLEVLEGVRMPPKLESVDCNDKNEAVVRWAPPQGDLRIFSYSVRSNVTFGSGKSDFVAYPPDSSGFKTTIQMKPWANYTFHVISNNNYGISLPSEYSKTCETQPDVPSANPQNIKVEIIHPNKISLSWTPVHETKHNGPDLRYQVFWRKDSPEAAWESKDVFNLTSYTIENLQIFPRYIVKLIAVNQVGPAKDFSMVVVHTGQALEAPKRFLMVELKNNTCALLTWDPASPELLLGDFKGYKMQTWPIFEGDVPIREISIPRDVNEFYLTDLKPFTEYMVKLYAYNSTDSGPSASVAVDTTNDYPSKVENLSAQVLDFTSVLLKWEQPLKPNGRVTGYEVEYGKIIDGKPQITKYKWTSKPNGVKINDLRPDSIYQFKVSASNSFGTGEGTLVEAETEPRNFSLKPSKPNFSLMPLTGLKIIWHPSNDAYPGEDFFVKFRAKGAREWERSYKISEDNYMTMDPLKQNTTYQFQVVSVFKNYEMESDIKEIKID